MALGKKVLITGGAGFVGSHLAISLLDQGYEVVALDNLSTGNYSNIEKLIQNKSFSFTNIYLHVMEIGTLTIKHNCIQGNHVTKQNGITFRFAKNCCNNNSLSTCCYVTRNNIIMQVTRKKCAVEYLIRVQ